MNRKIGIVTVLYNSETVLEEFFSSLNAQTYRDYLLYIVDNLSSDGSLALSHQLAEKSFFQTVFIENKTNVGVAKGNNQGIQMALSDGCGLILLSNNDVSFGKDTLSLLLKGLESRKASMSVPKIYYYGTDLIWTAGGSFNKLTGKNTHTGEMQKDTGQYQIAKEITYSPTCFMLIHKEVFETVGLMDENYFVYYDDTDFVYRALKKHQTMWYIPESVVYHKVSTSTGILSEFSIRYTYRNLVYFALKNYSFFYALYVLALDSGYNFFVLFFKWPYSIWKLRIKSYKEGYQLYKQTFCN